MDNRKVLLVDDEVNVLNGLKRQLRKQFDISTATSGQEALQIAEQEDPFAVVVSDMRMPGMNGVEVLERMQEISPDTTRVMLTGNADQQTAIDAVNEGNVFRFFTKPCPTEILVNGIEMAIQQYKLVTAERELLEQTLVGSVKVLVDVLSLSSPEAFGQTVRIRNWANRIAAHMKIPRPWEIDIAAALSTLGLAAVPSEVLTKMRAGEELNKVEAGIMVQVPDLGRKLIGNIPRLKTVAEIIYYQDKGYDGSGLPKDDVAGEEIPFGARLLKILKDLGDHSKDFVPSAAAFAKLEESKNLYDKELLSIVSKYFKEQNDANEGDAGKGLELSVSMLRAGDYLETDLEFENGIVFMAAGEIINDIVVAQILSLIKVNPLKEPVRVIRAT